MPYSGASDPDIPDHIPEDKKSQWVKVWNSTYEKCTDSGGKAKTCEGKAFKVANGVIRKREVKMDLFEKFLSDVQKVLDGFKERSLSMGQMYELAISAMREAEVDGWLTDLYKDDDGSMFAVTTQKGKLYRTPVTFRGSDVEVGETQEVLLEFVPRSRGFTIQRNAEEVRWISRSCTSIINKDGEIDSRDLFDSFVAEIERSGAYPYRTFWHKGEEFRTGQCDFVARDENVLVTSGVYDKSEFAEMEIKAREVEPEYWGESIHYIPTSEAEMLEVNDDISIPVYRSGTFVEISTVPDEYASAFYTNDATLKEVKRAMEPKEFEAFVKLFEGDEAKAKAWLVDNVDPVNREIVETDAISRDTDDVVETDEVETEVEEVEAEVEAVTEEVEEEDEDVEEDEFVLDEAAVDAIAVVAAERTTEAFNEQIGELAEVVEDVRTALTELQAANIRSAKELEVRLTTLEQSSEEALEGMLDDLPRNTVSRRVTYRPSEQEPSEEAEEPSMQDVADATLAGIK